MIPAFKNRSPLMKYKGKSWAVPDWPCPYCAIGIMEELEIKTIENEASVRARRHFAWDVDWIDGNAIGILKCNKKDCGESVVFIGRYSVFEEPDLQEDGTHSSLEYVESIAPLYFHPPLCLIPVFSVYPKKVQEELGTSFRLYWNEPESCANKIRSCVEHVLTNMKIPRFTKKKKFIPLHQRIDKLDAKYAVEKTHLMALKIIGNPGSHGQKIEILDLVNAYEILDHVLKRIFSKESKRIEKVSRKYVRKVK